MNKLIITKEMIFTEDEDKEVQLLESLPLEECNVVGARTLLLLNLETLSHYVRVAVNSSINIDQGNIEDKLEKLGNLKGKMFLILMKSNELESNEKLYEIIDDYFDDEVEFNEEAIEYLKQIQKETDNILRDASEYQIEKKFFE